METSAKCESQAISTDGNVIVRNFKETPSQVLAERDAMRENLVKITRTHSRTSRSHKYARCVLVKSLRPQHLSSMIETITRPVRASVRPATSDAVTAEDTSKPLFGRRAIEQAKAEAVFVLDQEKPLAICKRTLRRYDKDVLQSTVSFILSENNVAPFAWGCRQIKSPRNENATCGTWSSSFTSSSYRSESLACEKCSTFRCPGGGRVWVP